MLHVDRTVLCVDELARHVSLDLLLILFMGDLVCFGSLPSVHNSILVALPCKRVPVLPREATKPI